MIYAGNLFVGIAVPLCVSLLFSRGPVRRTQLFFVGGMGICLLSAYTNGFLQTVTGFSIDDMAVYVTPITEECMKLLPLFFYILFFRMNKHCIINY